MTRRRVPVDRHNEPVLESPGDDLAGVPEGEESAPAGEEPGCDCIALDPADWDEVESDWNDITFLPLSVGAVLGVPIGYQNLLKRIGEKARRTGLVIPDDRMILVGQGRFRRPVWVEVEVPAGGEEVGLIRPGGIAYSRLLPAAYGDLKRRFEETAAEAMARYGRKPDRMWTWFLTCRKCSAERNFETLFVAHYGPRL